MAAISMSEVAVAPGGRPLIGHLLPLARSRMDFLVSLNSCGKLVEVRLGTRPAYVVTHPDLLHQMLVTEAQKFDKGRIFDKARRFVGNGLATASTETHRTHRRMLQPAFHHKRISAYAATMTEIAGEIVTGWRPGQTIEMGRAMDEMVTQVVSKILFSSDLGEAAVAEVHRSLSVVVSGAALRAVLPSGLEYLSPDVFRYSAAVRRLKKVIASVIKGYRAADTDTGDLLSMVIAAQDELTGGRMGDQQIADEVMTFLLGGIESSAAHLAWIFYELAKNPDLERRLHEEVDSVLEGRAPVFDDLKRLELTNRIVSEALRAYAGTILMRRVIHPVELGGTRLPAGAEIIFSPYAVHRDPRWFPEPDRFDPDRWLPERAANIPAAAFVPFGSGARKCIGNHFSMTEMGIVIALIASRWRLRLTPGRPVRALARAAVHPSPMYMVCEPRF